MPRLPEVQALLPVGLVADDDDDTVTLRCLWCGWERVYTACPHPPARILDDAIAHLRTDARGPDRG